MRTDYGEAHPLDILGAHWLPRRAVVFRKLIARRYAQFKVLPSHREKTAADTDPLSVGD